MLAYLCFLKGKVLIVSSLFSLLFNFSVWAFNSPLSFKGMFNSVEGSGVTPVMLLIALMLFV